MRTQSLVTSYQPLPWVIIGLASALVVALTVSLQFGFFIALFTALACWTWRQPHTVMIFFIILAPLLPMLKITQTIGTVTLLKDVIILTLFVKLFALPLITRTLPYRRNPFALPVLGLLVWVAIATVRAAVVMLLAGYQWFFAGDSAVLRFDPARSIWIPRISSILAHPSILGHYLGLIATFLIAVIATWRGHSDKASLKRKRSERSTSPEAKLARRSEQLAWPNGTWQVAVAITLTLASLLLIYLTYSRAVWIGLVLAFAALVAVWAWRQLQQRYQVSGKHVRWAALILIGLIIVAGFGARFTPANTFIQTIFDPTYASNAERLEFAARLIAPMTNAEALLGRGLGDVTAQQFREIDVTSVDIATGADQAVREAKDRTLVDNQYLKSFVELGLIGVLFYLWIFFVFMKQSLILATSHQLLAPQLLGLWGIGFLVFFVSQGFFIDVWEIFPTNAAFWIIAALLARALTPLEASSDLAPDVDQP